MASKIMVVEDSESMRQLVGFALRDAGYDVIEAENGRDALEKLNGVNVSVVVTDLNMPEMNGLALIRAIRQMEGYRFMPVVVLATESRESLQREAQQAGASAWISKPFTPDALLAVVRRFAGDVKPDELVWRQDEKAL
jgi:two-component system chemotaxis response regulator CheY